MDEIAIYELKRMDLRGSTVIEGFPSVGLVSTITANYLISILKLEQIGVLDSVHFPTVSVVRNAEPLNPVRIYATNPQVHKDIPKLVVFISEFQPSPQIIKMIASTILDWMQEQGCTLLISPEGLVIDRDGEDEDEEGAVAEEEEEEEDPEAEADAGEEEEEGEGEDDELVNDVITYGIGSTDHARELITGQKIKLFEEGVISGVAGVLLNEGKRRGFDVISLLAEARPNYPDARAAARVIEAIDNILLKIDIDVKPLYSEAEGIEGRIKAMQKQAKPGVSKKPSHAPSMYG